MSICRKNSWGASYNNCNQFTDTSGNILAQYTYSPYGQRTKLTGTLGTNLGFTGHYHHQSGIILTHYRAYNPALGRWLSPDPLGELGGDSPNVYSYVLNNPINAADPNGLIIGWLTGDPDYTWSDYASDVGDVFVGQAKGAAGNLSFGLYDPCYKNSMQKAGGVQGDALATGATIATGAGLGWKAAGSAARNSMGKATKEFSHWIPDRVLKRTNSKFIRDKFGRSKFNGNYVNPRRHAQHDPKRFLKGDKGMQGKFNPAHRQLDRIPNVYKGAAVGAAYSGTSNAARNGNCD